VACSQNLRQIGRGQNTSVRVLAGIKLSTEFVHNHVDRAGQEEQTPRRGKNLRQCERVFTTARCCEVALASSGVEHGRRDTIAAGVFAAIKRGVGNLQHALGEVALTGRHAIQSTHPKAGGDFQSLAIGVEGRLRHACAQFARYIKGGLIAGFRQHYGKLFAADASHPVDAASQNALQSSAELTQDLIPRGVTEGVIDGLEAINVAQDEREGAAVARRALYFAREMLTEETPAGQTGQVIGRREFAVFGQSHPQYGFQLGNAARDGKACVDLAFRSAPSDAVVCAGSQTCLALGILVEVSHIKDERRPLRLASMELSYQVEAVGDDDFAVRGLAAAQGLLLIRDYLDLEHIRGNVPLELTRQLPLVAHEHGLWRRYHAQHYGNGGRRLFLIIRRTLGATLEDALNDGRLAAAG
jgi:hypothetical protein